MPSTRLAPLGPDGPQIPAVGFGLMGLSVAYGSVASDEERLKVLDRAWEIGCVNWDTSDGYGDSEDLVGKWFKLHPERRKDIFLATKFGFKSIYPLEIDSSPEYCKQALQKSLDRLGVDSVDLYYMHRANRAVPIEKTVQAMKELKEAGKIKHLGLSEISSKTLRRAHTVCPISAVQIEYNPWDLDIEGPSGTHLLDTCKELGVTIFAYSPLGRGILTGRYRSKEDFEEGDFRVNMERYQGDNFKKNLVLVDKFKEVADRKGVTSSQLVLAWLLAQWEKIVVIPGTKSVKYLEENFGAAEVHISPEEEKELRELVKNADIGGGRDPFFGDYDDTAEL
ncbi:NADP-dependent oxidoreductase domain-containing protein [Plectosphaerella cucumerina]|uniref:NADP-dependent oxidoreductase domain-containing protein n=1 Tax=Plectosphaerella cucumerina TaxID=40658 RepID=A0A8K0TJE8_9PEZI|nr:NADP-dependent oxidoreductase domain-containing protein [Plectosphaerella cucumerina]